MTTIILLGLFLFAILWFINEYVEFNRMIDKGVQQIAYEHRLKNRLIASKIRLNNCRAKKCEDKGITLKPYSESEEQQLDEEDEFEEDEAFAMPDDYLEES